MASETKDDSIPGSQAVEEAGQTLTARNNRKVTERYEPENATEKGLDRWINLKFDLFVVLPLSLGFMFIASRYPVPKSVCYIFRDVARVTLRIAFTSWLPFPQ